jgi:hypothetical protein
MARLPRVWGRRHIAVARESTMFRPNDPMHPAGPSRRGFVLGSVALAATADAAVAADTGNADFLFVQTAKGMAYSAHQNRLTLRGVSPVTLFFSDRPERIAGNMRTADFVPFWSKGKDSFLSDPPNADLSIMEDGKLRQTVVVLQDPVVEGEDLHYTVRILDGVMPELGEEVSVFIDVIGMPLTPLSFAGARRRAYRRAFLY